MLAKLKVLLQLAGTTYDVLLQAIIDACEADFLNLTHRDTLPDTAEYVVIRMAMARYNTLKGEGLANLSIDGINEQFVDYGNLYPLIRTFRKVVIV